MLIPYLVADFQFMVIAAVAFNATEVIIVLVIVITAIFNKVTIFMLNVKFKYFFPLMF